MNVSTATNPGAPKVNRTPSADATASYDDGWAGASAPPATLVATVSTAGASSAEPPSSNSARFPTDRVRSRFTVIPPCVKRVRPTRRAG